MPSNIATLTHGATTILSSQPTLEGSVGTGIEHIFLYDDIAISVLFACLIFSMFGNVILLRTILKGKDVLNNLAIAINTLSVRLSMHQEDAKGK